jgi:hypothetical protein
MVRLYRVLMIRLRARRRGGFVDLGRQRVGL